MKLDEVLHGNLLTHPALPETEEFIASVIRRKIKLLMRTGNVEKVNLLSHRPSLKVGIHYSS